MSIKPFSATLELLTWLCPVKVALANFIFGNSIQRIATIRVGQRQDEIVLPRKMTLHDWFHRIFRYTIILINLANYIAGDPKNCH
jgi:hypothetical protein